VTSFPVNEDEAIGLIPARGGSKSIPLKNLVDIGGRPLIAYVISAGKEASTLSGIFCSTDHPRIAAVCREYGVEILDRPASLAQDDTPVADVVRHVLQTFGSARGRMPGMVALLQPTSPFLLAEHVDACVAALRADPEADSAQTVTPVFHNAHAFNQRIVEGNRVRFRFEEERRAAFNKQLKPRHYLFGNLVVARARTLLAGKDCFGKVSVPVEITRTHSLDVDTAEDVDYATHLVREGRVPGLST
jgi:CMP-N,N'-diacetyllegionaminic acid synthase